ncbi:MAG: hypothetical protein ABIG34_01580 [Candidatus Peregrinibacteria bacterium]
MRLFIKSLWLAPLTILLGLFFYLLNIRYPFIGHDYHVFIFRLLAGKWHFLHQGLSPFRYAVHFGGGMPMYGDPEGSYYSLMQLFIIVIHPWLAIQLAIGITMALGYVGWYLFGRDIIHLTKPWAHAFAVVILTNGFYLAHMAVGHIVYHTFPMVGFLFWLLLERKRDSSSSLLLKACLFSLIFAYIFYGGGYFVLILAVLGFIFALPFDFALSRFPFTERLKILAIRILAYGLGALLICSSKLVSVYSLMRFFPRTTSLAQFQPDTSALLFVMKAFWFIPQRAHLFNGTPWRPHESTMLLSPITLIGIFSSLFLLWIFKDYWRKRWLKLSFLAIYSGFLFIFFLQLTRGYGFLVQPLVHFFPFSSIRVAQRFLYVFSLFVSTFGVWSLYAFIKQWRPGASNIVAISSIIISLTFFVTGNYALINNDLDIRVEYDSWKKNSLPAITQSLSLPITEIQDIWPNLLGNSSLGVPSAVFYFHNIDSLHVGPVTDQQDGFYNLINPSCYQFPTENNCKPGDRIPVSDRENFENFRKGLPTQWKLSSLQKIADATSLITLVTIIVLFITEVIPFSFFRLRK